MGELKLMLALKLMQRLQQFSYHTGQIRLNSAVTQRDLYSDLTAVAHPSAIE